MAEIIDFKETENKLFNRKEIVAVATTEASISYAEAEKMISEKASVPIENIKIKRVKSGFGKSEFEIIAEAYGSKGDKEKYVKKTKQEKEADKKVIEDAAEAPVPAEEKPAEPVAEEKKEETKPEEKKE